MAHKLWSKERLAETTSSIRSGARELGIKGSSWLPDGMLQDAIQLIVAKIDEKPTVDTTDAPANGEVLTYDSASGKYKPSPSGGGGGAVSSVFTRTGAVVAQSGDYSAGQITNAPAGNIAAPTVQAALNELDSEKATPAQIPAIASQAQADAGTDDTTIMTPLKSANMLRVSPTEVSVTGAQTLTSSAFGKMHVCSGASNYAVGLPAVSGNAGKVIGIRVARNATGLITIDPNASETLNGVTSWVLGAGESMTLLSTGSEWVSIGGYKTNKMLHLERVANQSLANNAFTAISWDTEVLDELGAWSSGTNITIPNTAKYNVTLQANFASNATGIRTIRMVRATIDLGSAPIINAVVDSAGRAQATFGIRLTAGDVVSVEAFQNSGGALNLGAVTGFPTPSLRMIEQ